MGDEFQNLDAICSQRGRFDCWDIRLLPHRTIWHAWSESIDATIRQVVLSPLMKGPEVSELTGCASWVEMQQRSIQTLDSRSQRRNGWSMTRTRGNGSRRRRPAHRHEVTSWFEKVLPVAEHYLRRQRKTVKGPALARSRVCWPPGGSTFQVL